MTLGVVGLAARGVVVLEVRGRSSGRLRRVPILRPCHADRDQAGRWLAGETVDVTCDGGLVHIYHQGVLIATHARRHDPDQQAAGLRRKTTPPAPKPTASAVSVTRKVDSSGTVSFAGSSHRVGAAHRRRQVQVAVVGDAVEISIGSRLIRIHKAKHDRTREHGAPANPGGRPNRINAA